MKKPSKTIRKKAKANRDAKLRVLRFESHKRISFFNYLGIGAFKFLFLNFVLEVKNSTFDAIEA